MLLKEFRELTKDLPEDIEMILVAKGNPFGNCWTLLSIEATSLSFFGKSLPAIKLLDHNPSYVDEDSEEIFHVHPEQGKWLDARSK